MSTVTSRWQQRRQAARTRRALNQALARTSSPALASAREEQLLTPPGERAQELVSSCRRKLRAHPRVLAARGSVRRHPAERPGVGGPIGRRPAMTGLLAEARETSGATTGGLLRYVRTSAGEAAVDQVLGRAGVPFTAEQLEDQSLWWSYETRVRLFEAASEVLDDPQLMFKVGASVLQSGLAHSLVILLRAMGTPRQVFRKLPRAVAKFSTTSTMEVLEAGASTATIRYTLHEGYRHSRLDCSYAQGLFSVVPTIFGLAEARIQHDECESDGHPSCLYTVSWDRRGRFPRRRRETAADPELLA